MQPFVVKLTALAPGVSHYDWHADAEFFGIFGNTEILDADLKVGVEIHNHGVTLDAVCSADGKVTVACDRCLENLDVPVNVSFEETYVPSEDDDLDLSQDIYDYICTALPLRRVHPDGECNEETTKYLSK